MSDPAPTTPDVVEVITRPNGNSYRPRKAPRAVPYSGEDHGSDQHGIIVLGTHDEATARSVAASCYAINWDHRFTDCDGPLADAVASRTWVRDAYEAGDRWWIHDPARGQAAVDLSCRCLS